MGFILAVDNLSHIHLSPCRRDCVRICQQYICAIQEAGLSSSFSWWFLVEIWDHIIKTTQFWPQQGYLFSRLSKSQGFFPFYPCLVVYTDELWERLYILWASLCKNQGIYFDVSNWFSKHVSHSSRSSLLVIRRCYCFLPFSQQCLLKITVYCFV